MTVLFHDIHFDPDLERELQEDKIIGVVLHEILYADDTIIYSRNSETLTKLLHKIQIEGRKYGLRLNENKCDLIQMNTEAPVFFLNGTEVKTTTEAKYLGCMMQKSGKPETEMKKRMADTYATWKKTRRILEKRRCRYKIQNHSIRRSSKSQTNVRS